MRLLPYYRANFFDKKAINILSKIVACKGKKLRGFRHTKYGNLDMISIMPSPTTGKYEVVSIQRQFTKMDKPQKEQLFSALKAKWSSLMSRSEAHSVIVTKKWDESNPIIFWDDIFGILNLTKVFRVHVIGGYGDNTDLTTAIEAFGSEYDDILLRLPSCSKALAPKLDID